MYKTENEGRHDWQKPTTVNDRNLPAGLHRRQPNMHAEVRRAPRGRPIGWPAWFAPLPVKFRADLTNAGIARLGDDSEARIADVPVRVHKLGVVEDVEKFEAEIESEILSNCGSLQKAEIGVVESGTMEGAAVGGPESSESG